MRDQSSNASRRRLRYPWLYALPKADLPTFILCRGVRYDHVETFKHDFFAATGLYCGPDGLAVVKLGRRNDFLTIPMAWLGSYLVEREVRMYAEMQGIAGVPRLIGRIARDGFLHAFVPGHPLGRYERVSDSFFDELFALLRATHARHIAYVDLNKRQNILVGADGKPYLIDFQVSLFLPPTKWRRLWPVRWLLNRFQQADWYHYLKHKRRLRPDLLTAAERERLQQLSIWIRVHRRLTRPLTYLRRRTLSRLRRGEDVSVAGPSAK